MAFKAGMNAGNAEFRRQIACYGYWFEIITAFPWILALLALMCDSWDQSGWLTTVIGLSVSLIPVYFLYQAHHAPKGVKGEDRIWRLTAGGISKAFVGNAFLTTAVIKGDIFGTRTDQSVVFWTLIAFVMTCLYLRSGKIKNVIIAGLIREVVHGIPSVISSILDIYVTCKYNEYYVPARGDLFKSVKVKYQDWERAYDIVADVVSIAVTCATAVILWKAWGQPKGKRKKHMAWAGILQLVLIGKSLFQMLWCKSSEAAMGFLNRALKEPSLWSYFKHMSYGRRWQVFIAWYDAHFIFCSCAFAFFWLSVSMGCCTDKFSLCCAAGKTNSKEKGRISVRIADKKKKTKAFKQS